MYMQSDIIYFEIKSKLKRSNLVLGQCTDIDVEHKFRCHVASSLLARSRKLFPELFGIVMEFQYSNSIPHRRRRCWTIFEDIIYIFLFFRIISRTLQSILLLFLPSFAEFFSDQFSSTLLLSASRLDGKNLPNNISRGTRVVHVAQAGKVSRSRAEFFLHVSTFLLLLLLRARRVLFFFISTEHLGARRRVRLVRRVAGSQWTTSGGKKKERERGKGKRIGDSLARVLESRVSRSGEKMEIFTSLCSFLFLSRKLDSLLLLLSSS